MWTTHNTRTNNILLHFLSASWLYNVVGTRHPKFFNITWDSMAQWPLVLSLSWIQLASAVISCIFYLKHWKILLLNILFYCMQAISQFMKCFVSQLLLLIVFTTTIENSSNLIAKKIHCLLIASFQKKKLFIIKKKIYKTFYQKLLTHSRPVVNIYVWKNLTFFILLKTKDIFISKF